MGSSSLAGTTQDEVRRHNLGSLLRRLHAQGTTSRSQLTGLTGLNRSTVGALVAELVDVGLAREEAPVGHGVGRPSIMVSPAGDGAHVVSVDIGVEAASVGLVGLGGDVLGRARLRVAAGERPRRLLGRIASRVTALEERVAAGSVRVGIGVGVPGVVRHADGLVEMAPNLGWTDVPLGELTASALGADDPAQVANDADLAAVAEQLRGAAAGFTHVVLVGGDVGVGGGIVVDGVLMTGARGYGGEVGHMVVNPQGRACRCGAVGCWETTIGEEAVRSALRARDDDDVRALLLRAHDDDPRLEEVGRWLGVGVRNLINIFNPQAVVFQGLSGELYPRVQGFVADEVSRSMEAPRREVQLRAARLGADAVVVGAAERAFEPLLLDPVGHLGRMRQRRVA